MRRSAVVTGSSSGIGRAIACQLARDGFWVLLADVRRSPLTGGEPTDELISRAGGTCEFVWADVALAAVCEELVSHAAGVAGRLDVLVNNAMLAGAHSKPLLETSEEDFDAIMAVNLRGPFLLCKAAVRQMLTQPARGDARGRIINITPQHGMVGAPRHAAYAVSKGGLVQLTRQIAVEHGRDGIICNAVAPGKVITGAAGGPEPGSGQRRVRPVAHPLRPAGRAAGRRRGRSLPGLGCRHVYQRHQPHGRRRLDGVLNPIGGQPWSYGPLAFGRTACTGPRIDAGDCAYHWCWNAAWPPGRQGSPD